jgi:hypothetical protein
LRILFGSPSDSLHSLSQGMAVPKKRRQCGDKMGSFSGPDAEEVSYSKIAPWVSDIV